MDVVLWGGTGQARVLRPIIEEGGHTVIAVFDRNKNLRPPFDNVPLFHRESDLEVLCADYGERQLGFAVAIGGTHGRERLQIAHRMSALGLQALAVQHRTAWVAESVVMGEGCQVLAMAVISEESTLGEHCIINTNASVDHECVLGSGVHVMPGATIAGAVRIADYATIGANATVLPFVRIGEAAVVGAGAVVTQDVGDRIVVTGVPARSTERGSLDRATAQDTADWSDKPAF